MPKEEIKLDQLDNVNGGVSHEREVVCPYCGQTFTVLPKEQTHVCPHCGCTVNNLDQTAKPKIVV